MNRNHGVDQTRYRHTFDGYFSVIYLKMKERCRKHKRYMGLPLMDSIQWELFLQETNSIRISLFSNWIKSDYKKNMAPSIDRIDSKCGYVPGNVRWIPGWLNSSLGSRKLTESQVKQIRALHLLGIYSFRQLGKQFQIDCRTVRDIVLGNTWKHLQETA